MHRLEQYFTSFQSFDHFFRHEKGFSQTGHILVGKSDFFFMGLYRGLLEGLYIGDAKHKESQSSKIPHLRRAAAERFKYSVWFSSSKIDFGSLFNCE